MRKASDSIWFRVGMTVAALGLCPTVSGAASPARAAAAAPDAAMVDAARQNAGSLGQLPIAPFRRPELGWEIYEPLIAKEIGAETGADTPAFAARLAAWQSDHHLARSGVVDDATIMAMKALWLARRPFVAASQHACPPPPDVASLATIPAADAYGGKVMQLRPAALAAYDRMLAAARAEVPAVRRDARLLTIFSAFRAPDADALRCAAEANCQGVTRASCSAHLTGLAIDVFLGSAPGLRPDSADDANRLLMSRGAPYSWMVANAGRFGFVPYPFEPWHWEWTGEPIQAASEPRAQNAPSLHTRV